MKFFCFFVSLSDAAEKSMLWFLKNKKKRKEKRGAYSP